MPRYVFAILALVLATIGIYGVVAYTVGLRTREMGIRMALGAKPIDVMILILWQVFTTAAAGLASGLVISLWLGQVVASLLFEVKPTDGTTICGVVGLIGAMALLAGYLPARRATRFDPHESSTIRIIADRGSSLGMNA